MGDVDLMGMFYGVKVGFGGVLLYVLGYSGEGIGILFGLIEVVLGLV